MNLRIFRRKSGGAKRSTLKRGGKVEDVQKCGGGLNVHFDRALPSGHPWEFALPAHELSEFVALRRELFGEQRNRCTPYARRPYSGTAQSALRALYALRGHRLGGRRRDRDGYGIGGVVGVVTCVMLWPRGLGYRTRDLWVCASSEPSSWQKLIQLELIFRERIRVVSPQRLVRRLVLLATASSSLVYLYLGDNAEPFYVSEPSWDPVFSGQGTKTHASSKIEWKWDFVGRNRIRGYRASDLPKIFQHVGGLFAPQIDVSQCHNDGR
ncbi:hypothetical protein DFH06DRAFT_1376191 [Mycena polygramma]|nr:hypothetical protein DFH06DRAFT_1376191 [Mycena polygramma]